MNHKVHYNIAWNFERTCSLTNSILAIRKAVFCKLTSSFIFQEGELRMSGFIDELIEFWGKHSILTLFVRGDRVALWLWTDETSALLGCHWQPEPVSRAVIHNLFEITLAWAPNYLLSQLDLWEYQDNHIFISRIEVEIVSYAGKWWINKC